MYSSQKFIRDMGLEYRKLILLLSPFSKTLMLREDFAEFLKGSTWFFILYQWHTQILLNVKG